MVTDPSFSEYSSSAVKQLAVAAVQHANVARGDAEKAEHVRDTWLALENYMGRQWPYHIQALLHREKPLLDRLQAEHHPAVPALEEIARIASEQAGVIRRRFPAYIEEASQSNHLPLDRDSRHPQYKFDGGFFKLEIDEYKGLARLSDYEGRLDEFPADVGAVVEAVAREHKRVFGREPDGKKFLKRLRNEYLAIIKKERWPDGYEVPIRHITRRLGKNAKGFRTDEFLIDLSRLVEQGPTEVEGFQLDLQQTKDTSQGMLLHGIAGRGYIGFVKFKRQ